MLNTDQVATAPCTDPTQAQSLPFMAKASCHSNLRLIF
jgi:hypothetical protein